MRAKWTSSNRPPVSVSMLSFDKTGPQQRVQCVLRSGELAGAIVWLSASELSYDSSISPTYSPFSEDFSTLPLPEQLLVVSRLQSARVKANEERILSAKKTRSVRSKKPTNPITQAVKKLKKNPEMLKLLEGLLKGDSR